MTDMKQPEALRLIAEWRNSMPIGVMRIWAADVRDELRRQHAEMEALRMRPQEASYTSVQLAEMILSDCGCSTNNTSLLERVAKRIDRHSDTLSQPAPAAVAGPSDWRELAAKVMDVLADAQESTNAAYPDHVSCYPEWETQARWLRWHAEMFRTGKPTGNGAGQPAVLAALAATPTTQPAPAAHKEQT